MQLTHDLYTFHCDTALRFILSITNSHELCFCCSVSCFTLPFFHRYLFFDGDSRCISAHTLYMQSTFELRLLLHLVQSLWTATLTPLYPHLDSLVVLVAYRLHSVMIF